MYLQKYIFVHLNS